MKFVLSNIKAEDRGPVKRALKRGFKECPAVTVKNGGGNIVAVKVINGPKEKDGQNTVAANIDAILMNHGYRFCNINHGN